jgi:large subunit ribosomal protein L22
MGKQANSRKVKDNEAIAIGKGLRSSPRKLNLLAQLIRGKKAADALVMLSFDTHRMAIEVKKVLQSAVSNAENNHQLDVDRLVVVEASVGRAFALRRFHARGRGRGAPVEKPFSHLRVVVREQDDKKKEAKKAAPKKSAAQPEAKAAAPKAKKPSTSKAKKE